MSTHPDSRTAVVLYTRDLRVHDHPGLVEAARSSEYVIPVFVLDDDVLDRAGPNRIAFLVEALGDLRESLRQRGADLVIRRGDPVAETLRLCRDVRAETVFGGEDVTPYARRREQRLATACQSVGIELRLEDGMTVVQPAAVAPDGGDHYRVFTPYWRRWREAPRRGPLSAPTRLRLPSGVAASELTPVHALNGRSASPGVARGGESEGRRRLTRWLADGLPSYAGRRDRLDVDGTSRLSAYLHFGCLSPLEVVTRAQEHPDSDEFVRQLCWRDFFHQLLAGNPETTHRDLHPGTDDRRPGHDALECWRGGLTGYPIVDAGMRQLAFEGWLPNRARLIVGSFLTSWLHWRRPGASTRTATTCEGGFQSSARSRGRSCTSRGKQRIRSSHPSTPLRSSSPRRLRGRDAEPMPARLEGFRSSESRAHDGSIETEQRVFIPAPVVSLTEDGGRALGRRYWLEVARVARGLIRARESHEGVEIDLAGVGLTLLALGPEEITVESDRVTCRYPIRGGLLSGAAGGELVVAQVDGDSPELFVAVSGFFARRGLLYRQLQRRLHVSVSRRYFRSLLAEDRA